MTVNGRDRGATIPIVALALPVLILMTAFAVDLGRQRSSRRTMQARADVIALDMVRLADGRTEGQILADPGYNAYLQGSADRNDIAVPQLVVEYGTWNEVSGFIPTLDTGIPDATRVTASETIDYFFQPGTGDTVRVAVASQIKRAGFKIGSFAAAMSTDASTLGLMNRLLDDSLNLSLLSYQGLADVTLDYRRIAVELGLGDPEELFTTDITARRFLEASADVLRQSDPSSAEVQLLDQVVTSPALDAVTVEDIVTVTPGSEQSALDAEFNVLDFLAGAAFIANGGAALGLPTVSLGLPGYEIANGSLSLIQAPAEAWGPIGTPAQTSQAATLVTSNVGVLSLGSFVVSEINQILPGACGLLVLGPLVCGVTLREVEARITTTLDLDLASALGTIADIRCSGTDELDIDVASSLLRASLGVQVEIVATGGNADPSDDVSLGIVPLTLVNERPASNGAADFVIPPDVYGVYKPATPGVGSLTGTTTLSGLGDLGDLLTPALNTTLNTIVTQVNNELVNPIAGILGVRFASADVAALDSIDCRSIILVG